MTEPGPESARLAAELRLLRASAGLSLSDLAVKTAYSKSSWQRYLSGRALPPWPAVRALCALASIPEPRILAHWELAEAVWSRRGAIERTETASGHAQPVSAEVPSVQPEPTLSEVKTTTSEVAEVARKRRGFRAALASVVLLLCVALTAAVLAERGADRSHEVPAQGFQVGCIGTACDGRDAGVMLCGVQPQTLLHLQTSTGAGLEVRYQPLCQAAWARVWNTPLGAELSLTAPGAPTQSIRITDPRSVYAFVYTSMVALPKGRQPMLVCLTTGSGTSHVRECHPVPAP